MTLAPTPDGVDSAACCSMLQHGHSFWGMYRRAESWVAEAAEWAEGSSAGNACAE